jgi:hypothetical protein
MKLMKSSKIMALLLLAAFLVTSTGNVFGYAWCVGDDGHVEVSYSKADICCTIDSENRNDDSSNGTVISRFDGEGCGLCLDFSAQQSDAVFFKRLKRTSTVSLSPFSSDSSPAAAIRSTKLLVANRVSPPLPRISQTILSHRTVVLLN